ncbi:hypothetical protein PENDEC_c013G07180 [Penicillium decumbens]|uniref:Uncharacterized protein n=1 Tax=Penicillium decumbens TaxID=69771 RepID=A0A1V6PA95_PENDC|nr:hypothetical protein PENDEC_c013G07180 [Penicillium decumbens]
MTDSQVHPLRKILLVVTTGGFTHAAPVLEIGRVLAERGHTIEFATLEGQEDWITEYDFVSNLHILGPGSTSEQLAWDISKGIGKAMASEYLWTYLGLKKIMDDMTMRPAMIIADFFVEAANDIHVQYNVPIAIMRPNLPPFHLLRSYIPGQPGLQLPGALTSENTSMWLRIKNEINCLRDFPAIFRAARGIKKMRNDHGIFFPNHKPKKPDYLTLINSFYGLQLLHDLPPTCVPIGPLLSPNYPPLDDQCGSFLSRRKSVLYIALGTYSILPLGDAAAITHDVFCLMDKKLIDGVIWTMAKICREGLKKFSVGVSKTEVMSYLLDNKHPDFLFHFPGSQRAILAHNSTKLCFTHGGVSSANEALYHCKPVLMMGIFDDQLTNCAQLVAGGAAESLSKTDELFDKAKKILSEDNGSYQHNLLQLKRFSDIAAHRKYHAANLIEQLMYNKELRFKDGKELQSMHLRTADICISAYEAKNRVLNVASEPVQGLA